MNNKNGIIKFLQDKGFYVALALIIIGAAIASFLAIGDMIDSFTLPQTDSGITQEDDDIWQAPTFEADNKKEEVPISQSTAPSTSHSQDSSVSQSAQSEKLTDTQASQTPVYISPLADSEIIAEFSGDELVYNETLKDWRTHNGVDYAGKEQQSVCAPISGKVKSIKHDELWGTIVEIEKDEVLLRLMGLDEKTMVKENQDISQGDAIGKLGSIAAEAHLQAHLHVEAEKNGQFVNPNSL